MRDIVAAIEIVLLFLALLVFITFVVYTIIGFPAEIMTCRMLGNLNPEYNFQTSYWLGCVVESPNGYWIDVDDARFLIDP